MHTCGTTPRVGRREYPLQLYYHISGYVVRQVGDFWASIPVKFKINQNLYRKFLYTYVFGPLGVDFENPKFMGFKKKGASLVESAMANNAFLGSICYRLDRCFPLFRQHVTKKFVLESNTIKRIKQIINIHDYRTDSEGYFTDAVATLILNSLKNS